MPDVSAPVRENVAGLSFNFLAKIRCWPVCNHLNLVEFIPGTNSLVFLFIGRKHFLVARRAAVQFDQMLFAKIDILFAVPAITNRLFEQFSKRFFKIRQIDPVLRPFGSGDARLHLRQIQIDIDAVIDFTPERHAEHFLRPKIIFERKALFFAASGRPQVIDRLLINREISHRCAVLRRHVSDGRTIGHRQRCSPFTVKFDELPNDFLRAQQLCDV